MILVTTGGKTRVMRARPSPGHGGNQPVARCALEGLTPRLCATAAASPSDAGGVGVPVFAEQLDRMLGALEPLPHSMASAAQ